MDAHETQDAIPKIRSPLSSQRHLEQNDHRWIAPLRCGDLLSLDHPRRILENNPAGGAAEPVYARLAYPDRGETPRKANTASGDPQLTEWKHSLVKAAGDAHNRSHPPVLALHLPP